MFNWPLFATAGLFLLLVEAQTPCGFTPGQCKKRAALHGGGLVYRFLKDDGNCVYEQARNGTGAFCTEKTMLATFQNADDFYEIPKRVSNANTSHGLRAGFFKNIGYSLDSNLWINEKTVTNKDGKECNYLAGFRCDVQLDKFDKVARSFFVSGEGTATRENYLAILVKDYNVTVVDLGSSHNPGRFDALCQDDLDRKMAVLTVGMHRVYYQATQSHCHYTDVNDCPMEGGADEKVETNIISPNRLQAVSDYYANTTCLRALCRVQYTGGTNVLFKLVASDASSSCPEGRLLGFMPVVEGCFTTDNVLSQMTFDFPEYTSYLYSTNEDEVANRKQNNWTISTFGYGWK